MLIQQKDVVVYMINLSGEGDTSSLVDKLDHSQNMESLGLFGSAFGETRDLQK